MGEVEQKNWLKNQDYHFKYLRVVKLKIPLISYKNTDYERTNSNKSEDLTIFKDEILKNIQEI